MPYILSIETATPILSVALHQNGKTITSIDHHVAQSHSSKVIMNMITYILKLDNRSLQELEAIAISAGPGSYTGLRVGLSFAKGLCLGTGLPLIGVDTLESMIQAAQAYTIEGVYCALLDARQDSAYGLLADACGNVLEPTKKYKLELASFEKWLNKQHVYFIGSNTVHNSTTLQSHTNSHFIHNIHPSASYMGQVAYTKFLKKAFVDIANFEPYY